MKKTVLFLTAAFSALFLSGCATTKIEPSTLNPVAIVCIKGNGSLPWHEFVNGVESEANEHLIDAMLNNRVYADNPEIATAIERLDYADESFRKILGEQIGIEFVDKETFTKAKWYKRLNEGLLSLANTSLMGTGYKDIQSLDRVESRGLNKDTGSNSYLYVKFEFYKELTSGTKITGKIAPFARMTVKLTDAQGKELLYKIYKATGTEDIKLRGRDYDKTALTELYKPLIDQLVTQFALSIMERS